MQNLKSPSQFAALVAVFATLAAAVALLAPIPASSIADLFTAALAALAGAPALLMAAAPLGLIERKSGGSTSVPEIVESLNEFMDGFEDFKSRIEKRIGALDAEMLNELKRRNRPGFDTDAGGALSHDQRKSLDLAARALIAGDEPGARQHFVEAKAMLAGNDPSGGYLVMPAVSDAMTKVMLEVSPLLGAVRTIDIDAGDEWEEIVDRAEAGITWVGEVDDRPDTTSPELGKFTVPLHEIYAQPAVSQKLIDSAAIDVMEWLQGKLGEKFASAFNSAVISGNGAAKPLGFLSVPANTTDDASRAWGTLQYVVTGTSGAFAASDPTDCLNDVVAALKPQYRKDARWLMSRTTAATLRKLKTTTGESLWQPVTAAGQPPALMGFPVLEDDYMPAVGANSFSIAFGNFTKGYVLVRRLGLRFLVDPYTAKPKVRLYAYQRVGGGVANSEAIKLLKFGTA